MKANLINSISTAYEDYVKDRNNRNYEGAHQHREEANLFYDMLTNPHSNNHVNPLDLAYLAYAMLEEASFMLTLCDTDEMPLNVEEHMLRDRLIEARILVRESIREHDKDSDFWKLFINLTGAMRLSK